MPVESRVGNASPHLTATARPVILHRQRVPGNTSWPAETRILGEQLPCDVSYDGRRSCHVRDASTSQPDSRCREAYAKLSRPRRGATYAAKNIKKDIYCQGGYANKMNSSNCIINK